jgi:hypothetical protein
MLGTFLLTDSISGFLDFSGNTLARVLDFLCDLWLYWI